MQTRFLFPRIFSALLICSWITLLGCASPSHPKNSLRDALTFYSSFDHGVHADFASGDKQLYGTPGGAKAPAAQPGLPETKDIHLAKNRGRGGDALHYVRKNSAVLFYKGAKNVDYKTTNWSGSVSFWLKLNPDEELEPGYCDPLQISAGSWNDGVFFAEFSKDQPRRFRFALRPLLPIWNPQNLGWEAIAVKDRPMVEVVNPPFSREQWTHVVFTFANANTGCKDGVGQLYLNGRFAGEFREWDLSLNWQPEQMQVILGAAYVGLFDELALFNRVLSDGEIKTIFAKKNALRAHVSTQP